MSATVLHGDARALPLADGSVDAVVCDPPYELGFMSRSWDSTGVAYDPATWREAYRVLKPGGHLLAFGGSRTWHRLAVAVEDAGFELRDSIAWLYGSGFPKSLDVSKAIDKAAGAKRPVVGHWEAPGRGSRSAEQRYGLTADAGDITAPATDDARRWEGWGTALKPAFEPIVVARKPFGSTVAANVLTYGTGALNIDGCRVDYASKADREQTRVPNKTFDGSNNNRYGASRAEGRFEPAAGRWPANVVLSHAATPDGDDACADGCVPGCPVAELDAQSGVLTSGANPTRRNGSKFRDAYGEFAGGVEIPARGADSGGASRFFPAFRYQAKAPTSERPKVDGVAHPTVKPLGLMRWLVRLVTPPGGLVLDPFAGSGTTGEAALIEGFDVVLNEQHEPYLALIEQRLSRVAGVQLDLLAS